jgi:squalene-hopene/tetraprenyl-beta-curcumene cyclase
VNHSITVDIPSIEEALNSATAALLDSRNDAGHWEGELSSSALSTATAIFAIGLYQQWTAAPLAELGALVDRGINWLLRSQNPDGGWGDTIVSLSNISTTALCWAAMANRGERVKAAIQLAEAWLVRAAGSLRPADLARAIKLRYGKDRTFSVPILTMCALAGRLGEGRGAWTHVPQLPFELAACPYQWFQWLRLPVVSYALPALIAMGQVRHVHRPTGNPVARAIRRLTRKRTLRLLGQIQPKGGGFLEATPLTSFVVMSLLGAGGHHHPVVGKGIDFLARSARPDGSWPIDTNLATWLTTLSVNALAQHPRFNAVLGEDERKRITHWLIGQQFRVEHPYTHAAPGAWAWTDLPGGVPDADDTAGALLALSHLIDVNAQVLDAARAGVIWLLNIQNRDGGIPTFCRGWGNLPFDRSGCDLTAHALQAWCAWRQYMDQDCVARIDLATAAGMKFLEKNQRPDGSWVPLWFGNQWCPDDQNSTYGTAKVLSAICTIHHAMNQNLAEMCRRAAQWLMDMQKPDGGWGGGAAGVVSIEETSLAVHALAIWYSHGPAGKNSDANLAISRGAAWLVEQTKATPPYPPAPVGFYFARLWYFERQYPIIFACAALARATQLLSR